MSVILALILQMFVKCKTFALESMFTVLFVKHDELMQMRLEHTWHWALLANLKAFTNYTFTSSEKKLIFKTVIIYLELLMSQFSFVDFEVCSATKAQFRSMVKEIYDKNCLFTTTFPHCHNRQKCLLKSVTMMYRARVKHRQNLKERNHAINRAWYN